MKRSRLVIIIAVVTALFLCMETTLVSAKSLSEIRKDISAKQAELEKGEKKESDLAEKISQMEDELYQLKVKIDEGEAELKVLEEELAEAQAKVDTQNKNLGDRLRNMYKNGSVGFVDVLLDSNSFSEFLTNLTLVEKVYASDREVLDGLQTAYDEIDKKKQEVETLQAELEESEALLEEEVAVVIEEKKKIETENNQTEAQLKEMEAAEAAEEAKLKDQIDSGEISDGGSSSFNGIMAWPTPGYTRITSDFGYRLHPIYGTWKMHSGVDIGAPKGARIVAAESGKVFFARKYDGGGYGKHLKIDHGGGITTLYAHCSSIAVNEGQYVKKGQTVAYVGSTGASTGAHLHFEVRKNGVAKNPISYIK